MRRAALLNGLTVCAIAVAAVSLVAGPARATTVPLPPLPPSPFAGAPSVVPLAQPKLPESYFAPVDRPGPELSVPREKLRQSLYCSHNAHRADRPVALFVPGTTLTPREDFSWNWFKAMDKLGRPYCAVTEPDNAMSDAQVSAEYVVYAIRQVHALSGQKVQILGHSQGGTEPRFALRFWPDLRDMVEDYIGFAPTNHGSHVVNGMCVPGCSPSLQQQRTGSLYTQAMNSRQETFPGISYTVIYTATDEFVQPNLDERGTSSLHGGGGQVRNIATQEICPGTPNEHLSVATYDAVGYAIAMDALDHPGPADPRRISRDVCTRQLMPGVDPVQFPAQYADLVATIGRELALHPKVLTEPKLKPYTRN